MIKQDNGLGNIKNMQKEQRLFTLIHIINSRSEGREIVNIVLIILSMIGNVINFLSLKEIGVLKEHIFLLGDIFNLVFLPLLGMILLELLIGFFYQVQFFISIQWKIFRFLMYPFVMCYLIDQALNGTFINSSMAMLLLIVILVISLLLTAVFSTESYAYKKLLHRDLPVNFYLLIVQTLFYASSIIKNKNIEITAALLLTMLSYNIYHNNFSVLKESSYEFRILCVNTFILLWCGMVFTVALFTETEDIFSLIVASIPCLAYKICSDVSRQRAPVPYRSFTAIFEDPDSIDFEEFISSLQPVIEEIMEYYYSQNKQDFVETLLISFYYEHSNRCLNMNCPFKNEDYKYELRNMNDSKNMKEVLFKICKKIDYVYYGMYKSWPEHIDLKLSLVQFYIFCFPNKIKAMEIISEIELSKLTFQQEYQLFRVKILCQNMTSLQVAGELKLDQRLLEFENLVYLTLNTMMEFWSLFYQEKIDFNKLTSITSKIFPLRKKIEEIFEDRLTQETFSTLQILKLYSLYCASIESNQEKVWRINDYLEKLRSKLQQHKEIEYLSFDSEIGLVALSLSENKLGSIAMVNSQASAIFNYTKREFKNIKVNEIMPKTFADQHDNYLKVFLQNRTKKINSDERKLFGKNKAGYIFPILLQLQRTVSSTGDQLLFIANIKKLKMKQAGITCVTDEEGEICDISSTFDYFFFRQEKSRFKTGSKNIQEFIPEFFDPSVEQDENTHCKHFKQMITLKSFGKVDIEYSVSAVSFPLKQNGGFIVQGNILTPEQPILFPHLSMTQSLRAMMNREILSAHKTTYNLKLNRYELSKTEEPINLNEEFQKRFTIPFININDVTDIFGMKKEVVVYGSDIKTIRLVDDHFERVQDQSQFLSEIEQERTQSAQTIGQIMELKESIMKEKKPTFMRNIKLCLLILSIACVLVFVVLINQYDTYSSSTIGVLEEVKYKYRTRGYLSEYITYFTMLGRNFGPNLDIPNTSHLLDPVDDLLIHANHSSSALQQTLLQKQYDELLGSTKDQLIDSLENSPILETKKEEILRVVYLQNEANLTDTLQQLSQQFTFSETDVFSPILTSWYSFFGMLAVLILVTAMNYCLFMSQLESVYQVFMCLEEKVIKKLYMECKNLAKMIETSSQKEKIEDKSQQKIQGTVKLDDDDEEDNQNPVKKIRKFKENQQFRNLVLLSKLIFPFAVIILVSIFNMVELYRHNWQIKFEAEIHREMFKVIPETSVQLMNTLIVNTQQYNITYSPDFSSSYQKIDEVVYAFLLQYPGHSTENYYLTLLNNTCNGSYVRVFDDDRKIKICQDLIEGTLGVGLSKAVNYLANTLKSLQTTPNNATIAQNFNDLIMLEYQFVFPLVEHMAELMFNEVKRETDSFSYRYSTIAIIMIILIGVNFLYFAKYPAQQIEEKIQLSKGLIDLLPEYYKNEKATSKEGYLEVNEGDQGEFGALVEK